MRFNIDVLPLEKNIIFSADYIARLIYSATADCLTIYKSKSNDYICNNCTIENIRNEQWLFKLRSDIFYCDGKSVSAEDYVNNFILLMESKTYAGLFLRCIDSISLVNNMEFTIVLKRRSIDFFKLMSMYQYSPVRFNNITCGPYYISSRSEKKIVLKQNLFYRHKEKRINKKNNNEIVFSISKSNIDDIDEFQKDMTDVTNNTTFPYDKINSTDNVVCQPSYIWMHIMFSINLLSDKHILLRQYISYIINKLDIANALANYVIPTDDYIVSYYEKTKCYKHKFNETTIRSFFYEKIKFCLKLGYTDYYPNIIVARIIQRHLIRYGIIVSLHEEIYGITSKENDLHLKLTYPPYISPLAFYATPLFKALANIVNNKEYLYFLHMAEEKLDNVPELLENFNFYVATIPLIKMNSIYLIKKDYEVFDFVECNYADI
jgi:ABC-type transport system substrate-binding protein